MSIDPETLAAYADGELAPDEAARVEAAMAADPELGRQVAAHRALRAQLSAHFAPILDAPVPDRLTALLKSPAQPAQDNVVDLAAIRQARAEAAPAPVPRRRWMAAARSPPRWRWAWCSARSCRAAVPSARKMAASSRAARSTRR